MSLEREFVGVCSRIKSLERDPEVVSQLWISVALEQGQHCEQAHGISENTE